MDYEMRIPNGIGEEMLSEAYEKFDIELKQTEYGPKLIGSGSSGRWPPSPTP